MRDGSVNGLGHIIPARARQAMVNDRGELFGQAVDACGVPHCPNPVEAWHVRYGFCYAHLCMVPDDATSPLRILHRTFKPFRARQPDVWHEARRAVIRLLLETMAP